MAKQENGPPKKYDKTFKQCKTEDERVALVRQAMQDGHSNKSAAKALGLGKRFGVVAGIRRKHNIASQHRPSHGTAIEAKPASSPPPEPEPAFEPFTPPVDMTLRFAGSDWMHQCKASVDGGQCGLLQIEGEDYCPEHIHLKNKKQ